MHAFSSRLGAEASERQMSRIRLSSISALGDNLVTYELMLEQQRPLSSFICSSLHFAGIIVVGPSVNRRSAILHGAS